ncbi:hypothetical protein B9Z55_024256 [Caenorhabditis nigoni]|uniref:Uncharacterized protein n=1 Tax=Caenorhabditis nigoni TaxID=1611254 RepID=A0A2G5STR3_9PELO|nr:hypothetical protein B9Z55_024256 [Caenorhabditis nigoni]
MWNVHALSVSTTRYFTVETEEGLAGYVVVKLRAKITDRNWLMMQSYVQRRLIRQSFNDEEISAIEQPLST